MTPLRPFLNPFTMGTTPVKNIQILQRKLPKIQRKNLEKSKCNGVIRIMIFKSLRKIHWIDNSLCTLEKKFENILKDLKIWINFSNLSNYQIFQKMSKFEKFIQIFKFFRIFSNFFSRVQNELSIQCIFRNDLKIIILITPLLFILSKKGNCGTNYHQVPLWAVLGWNLKQFLVGLKLLGIS